MTLLLSSKGPVGSIITMKAAACQKGLLQSQINSRTSSIFATTAALSNDDNVSSVRLQSSVGRRQRQQQQQWQKRRNDDFSMSTTTAKSANTTKPRPIYVAATRQHVGKTSTSLALVKGLQKRFDKVGFIKPVGQQSLTVFEEDRAESLKVDKDVVLVKEHFALDHLRYRHMSPVLIPKGYTKDYIDGKISLQSQKESVQHAYENISASSSVVLCEGTGHSAVGSIVGAGNAEVASWVGADMVLVANGGLGSTFDELELSRIYCQHHDVSVAGVIVNRVKVEKYDEIKYYLEKAMMENWGIPLLGCIPDRPFLGCPALTDLEQLFGPSSRFVSGRIHALRHYTMSDINLVATSLSVFLKSLRVRASRTLYVCHASRDDILLGFMGEYQRRKNSPDENDLEAALIVCEGNELDPHIIDMMDVENKDDAPPILLVSQPAQKVMEQIHSFTPKLNANDTNRVGTAIEHYESHIDFDLLLQQTGNTATSVGSSYQEMMTTKNKWKG